MQNKMNMKNKIHKCVPRNSQINLSAQEFERPKNSGKPYKMWLPAFRACKMLAENDRGMFISHINFDFFNRL